PVTAATLPRHFGTKGGKNVHFSTTGGRFAGGPHEFPDPRGTRSTSNAGENLNMKRSLIFLYGTVCYVISLVTFAYAFAFMGNLWIPNSIDASRTTPMAAALAIDLALLVVFALQHSVMARPAFKRRWTRLIPEPAERSTYMLFSCLALGAVMMFWQPMG